MFFLTSKFYKPEPINFSQLIGCIYFSIEEFISKAKQIANQKLTIQP